MQRFPLIAVFIDPFDLLYWLSPHPRYRPERRTDGSGPERHGDRRP
jgi:hypothetical protein